MTVNSINIAMGASWGAYNQKLTPETRAKLDELGIVYNPNITEAQGQELLRTAQSFGAQNQPQQSGGQNTQNFSTQKDPTFLRALELAQKLGITVDEDINFEELLSKIEQTLERQIASNKNDESALRELKTLSLQLADIQAQAAGSMGFDATNKALEMSLQLLGEYNKNFLNYNQTAASL